LTNLRGSSGGGLATEGKKKRKMPPWGFFEKEEKDGKKRDPRQRLWIIRKRNFEGEKAARIQMVSGTRVGGRGAC